MAKIQGLSSSCDVLFPEPSLVDSTVDMSVSGDVIYAAPSTSAYSTDSQEVSHIMKSHERQMPPAQQQHLNHVSSMSHTPSQSEKVDKTGKSPTLTSGSAVVVTGYVKDENFNHHQVKFLDVSGNVYPPYDTEKSIFRSQSDGARSADRVLLHDEDFHHIQPWHHRSLDYLASLDDNSKGTDNMQLRSNFSRTPDASNTTNSHDGHLVHKPPAGQRPVFGQSGVNVYVPRRLNLSFPVARRRTWSPPVFHAELSTGPSLAAARSYSNDQLNAENCYEDLDSFSAPPQLTSRPDNKHAGQAVFRPVALKPIVSRRWARPPAKSVLPLRALDASCTSTPAAPDDGYVSQEYSSGSHSHSTSNTSSSVSHASVLDSLKRARTAAAGGDVDSSRIYSPPRRDRKHFPTRERQASQPSPKSASNYGYIQTPSPCGSDMLDVEALLREKDIEIRNLRETMANNEGVIFQVYEEKRQNYAMELKEIHDEWTKRFREFAQKSFRTEQALLLQIFKLQQDRKTMKLDYETSKAEKENLQQKTEDLQSEQEKLNNKVEELQWEIVQKNGEISHLKNQLKQSTSEQATKNQDLFGLRGQLKDAAKDADQKDVHILRLKTELEMTAADNVNLHAEVQQLREQLSQTAAGGLNRATEEAAGQLSSSPATAGPTSGNTLSTSHSSEIDELKVELSRLKMEMERTCEQFEHERVQWLEEKNKVIRYQKHLQLNYVQMYRKNKMLETEVEQLMVELENRELKLTSENGPIEGESTC